MKLRDDDRMADVTLLSAEQVAELLSVHKRTVWRLTALGDIPAPVRLSDRITRWRLADLRDHLEGRR